MSKVQAMIKALDQLDATQTTMIKVDNLRELLVLADNIDLLDEEIGAGDVEGAKRTIRCCIRLVKEFNQ